LEKGRAPVKATVTAQEREKGSGSEKGEGSDWASERDDSKAVGSARIQPECSVPAEEQRSEVSLKAPDVGGDQQHLDATDSRAPHAGHAGRRGCDSVKQLSLLCQEMVTPGVDRRKAG
jgi:hypothetical protein